MLSIPAMLGMLAFLSWLIDIRRGGEPMAAVAWMTAVLTVVVLAFYAETPRRGTTAARPRACAGSSG